jgi:murein DD-endopeptidase MepM/ murein hydrolase activator NlpD
MWGMPHVRCRVGVVVLAWMLTLAIAHSADASSSRVAAVQAALKPLGLYPATIDGVRGPLTRRAVRRFQRRHRLTVDGIVGPQTRRALGRRGRPSLGSRLMHRGSRGWDVAALQFLLSHRGFAPGGIDGAYGPGTRRAVIGFQRARGLAVDGVAGPATVGALRHPSTAPTSGTTTTPVGDVRFYRPVPGPIGDGFGAPRRVGNVRYGHTGIDFQVPAGTLVQAAGVGVVVTAGFNTGGYGNLVVVQHRLGYTSWYAHMSRIVAYRGQSVSGGTPIGYVGSTGRATGPHLHFEVRRYDTPIDPLPYLLSSTAARATAAAVHCPRPPEPIDYLTVRIDDCPL